MQLKGKSAVHVVRIETLHQINRESQTRITSILIIKAAVDRIPYRYNICSRHIELDDVCPCAVVGWQLCSIWVTVHRVNGIMCEELASFGE